LRNIVIHIQTHNSDDAYYTDYIPYYFQTNLSNNEINDILSAVQCQFEENENCNNSDVWDIDIADLTDKLKDHEIYLIKCNKNDNYYIDLEDKYRW